MELALHAVQTGIDNSNFFDCFCNGFYFHINFGRPRLFIILPHILYYLKYTSYIDYHV